MAIDRVRPLGFETLADGGSQTDHLPTELKSDEDYVSAKGLSIEHSTDKRIEQENGNAGYRDEFSYSTFLPNTVGFIPFNRFNEFVLNREEGLKVVELHYDPSCGCILKQMDNLIVMGGTNTDYENIDFIGITEC